MSNLITLVLDLLAKVPLSSGVTVETFFADLFSNICKTDHEKAAGNLIIGRVKEEPEQVKQALARLNTAQRTLFTAGWRPAAGWVCVAGLAYQFIVAPIIASITGTAVHIDSEMMTYILATVTGLGGLRTVEKMNGRAR